MQMEADLIAQGVEQVDTATVKCYVQDLRTLIEEAEDPGRRESQVETAGGGFESG